MAPPPNPNGLWKTAALALMTGVIGWFTHAALDAGNPAVVASRGRTGETPTGWSVEQASKFIRMPEQLNAILAAEDSILARQRTILAVLRRSQKQKGS